MVIEPASYNALLGLTPRWREHETFVMFGSENAGFARALGADNASWGSPPKTPATELCSSLSAAVDRRLAPAFSMPPGAC
jgi:hypothetical protein